MGTRNGSPSIHLSPGRERILAHILFYDSYVSIHALMVHQRKGPACGMPRLFARLLPIRRHTRATSAIPGQQETRLPYLVSVEVQNSKSPVAPTNASFSPPSLLPSRDLPLFLGGVLYLFRRRRCRAAVPLCMERGRWRHPGMEMGVEGYPRGVQALPRGAAVGRGKRATFLRIRLIRHNQPVDQSQLGSTPEMGSASCVSCFAAQVTLHPRPQPQRRCCVGFLCAFILFYVDRTPYYCGFCCLVPGLGKNTHLSPRLTSGLDVSARPILCVDSNSIPSRCLCGGALTIYPYHGGGRKRGPAFLAKFDMVWSPPTAWSRWVVFWQWSGCRCSWFCCCSSASRRYDENMNTLLILLSVVW